MSTPKYILVLTSCPDLEKAKEIAKSCVENRLAACAHIGESGISSIYWWEGQLEGAKEFQIVLKTEARLWDQISAQIQRLHPFEVPEILSIPIVDGLESYLNWISAENSK